jgi:hypothetical protein
MKFNIADALIEFTHQYNLGEDVLLHFAIKRLKHSRQEFWRVEGLWPVRDSLRLFEGRPSEFICVNQSFSFSPFSLAEEYAPGLYFSCCWIALNKMVAFLFTIDREVKLRKHLVHDISDADTFWLKKCWSAYFWEDIEKYHVSKKPVLKGHRVIGKYMMSKKNSDIPSLAERAVFESKLGKRLSHEFQNFPVVYRRCLIELIPVFSYLGINLHYWDSPVFFLFLAISRTDKLKAVITQIRRNQANALLLISNDSDIDESLMQTGHSYTLVHVMEVSSCTRLCFYRLNKCK